MNSSSVMGGLKRFPLFLIKKNAILPMTPKVRRALQRISKLLNCSNSNDNFYEWMAFAFLWSGIRKGLCLEPEQLIYFYTLEGGCFSAVL